MSHPLHDIAHEGSLEDGFSAWIEITKGSRMKYELDDRTGFRRVGWVLFSTAQCPANYGFIPRTRSENGEPLGVLVLGQEPAVPMCILTARAIGLMRMRDAKGKDERIIAVHVHEPAVRHYRDIREIPPYSLIELKRFFEESKRLENSAVVIEDVLGHAEANAAIRAALEGYAKLRGA